VRRQRLKGAYAFTLDGATGLFMIHADQPVNEAYVLSRKLEVNIAGTQYPAEVSLKPMYDPDMERIKV
jgi:4-methylaminobutanoate oxidase (formaldehyde-forming)